MNNFNKLLTKYLVKLLSPSRPVISNIEYKKISEFIKYSEKILNLGSGSETVLGAKFWEYIEDHTNIVNLDINPGENVDIVADASDMPFSDKTFDLIICQAVLEHIKDPKKVISEIKRVLKKEGFLYCTVPFLQGYHADPDDYQRYTTQGIKYLLSDFKIIYQGVSSGPFSTIAWIIRDLFTFGKKGCFLYRSSRFISSLLSYPVSLIDYIFPKTDSYIRNASEYYYLAKTK